MNASTPPDGDTEPWPAVPVPTDRPRRPDVPSRCPAVVTTPRAALAGAGEALVVAGFAAVLFRWTGQATVVVDRPADRVRHHFPDGVTLRAAAAGAVAGLPAADTELRLAVCGDGVELHYEPRLFDEGTVERMLGHLVTLVVDALRSPDRAVTRLRMLPDQEAHRLLVEWNRTAAALPPDGCLHEAVAARAAAAPHSVAVVSGGRRWTYQDVDQSANRLAHHLRGLGIGPDMRVGLCLDRSPDLLVAMLAVLKAGGAYVPLDPDYPRERLAAMVSRSPCAVMVTRADLSADLPAVTATTVLLDRDAAVVAAAPAHDPGPAAGPDHLCYVMHTSGSTGTPKPIALCHRGVGNNLADLNARFAIGPGDAVLAVSSPSFDMSVYEFLGITAAGGTVVLPDPIRRHDPAHWVELLVAEGITIWNSAPAMLGLLVDHLEQRGVDAALPALRLVMLDGDWVPVTLPDRFRAVAPGARFVVMYGVTEVSIHSTLFEVTATDPRWRSIPAGRPMANQRVYLLDDALQPVPVGVAGQLHLAGVGLARGYLGQDEAGAERFVEWSYGDVVGERLYRTGDLARFGPDGLIELLGRMDLQVKINNIRIELGDVEAALRGHPGVRQVAVAAPGGRLVAYVVTDTRHSEEGLTLAAELRELAVARLPQYMVPVAFVPLARLPLTPNGKLDRRSLPVPPAADGVPHRAPRSATERALADIVAGVLGLASVGVDDDFIALGGDSVRAIQVASRAHLRGLVVTAGQVLRHRSVAAVAAVAVPSGEAPAAVAGTADTTPLVSMTPGERAVLLDRYPALAQVWPLSPMQAGMLFESSLDDTGPDPYQLHVVYHLTGAVDPTRLRAVVRRLLDRHPALRAAVVDDVFDTPVAVVVDDVEPPWREIDLRHLDGAEQQVALDRFLATDRAARFDLATPPLMRCAVARLGPRRATLVLTVHHALLDGWSERVLADDLERLYAGQPLGPVRGYGDHLAWLARRDSSIDSAVWSAELAGVAGPTTLVAPDRYRDLTVASGEVSLSLARGELEPGPELGTTTSTVVRAAWAILLSALTGRTDVVFGATVSGRRAEMVDVESMVGLFINTVPVRAVVEPDTTVDELLTALERAQSTVADHEHHGLTEIHRTVGIDPLFDTVVVVQSFPPRRTVGNDPGGSGVAVTRIESLGRGSHPLTLIVEPDRLTVQYDPNRMEPATALDVATRFRALARQLTTGAEQRIDTLAGLPTAPLHRPATVRACPSPTSAAAGRPPSAREEAVRAVVAEVLGIEQIGLDDDLFAAGCNSLAATRIIGRLRRTLGLEVSIRTIFQYPRVADLADRLTVPARPMLRRRSAPD